MLKEKRTGRELEVQGIVMFGKPVEVISKKEKVAQMSNVAEGLIKMKAQLTIEFGMLHMSNTHIKDTFGLTLSQLKFKR